MVEIARTIDKVRALLANEAPDDVEGLPDTSETPDLSVAFDPTLLVSDAPAHLSLVGLTPPGELDLQDAFQIPETLVPELQVSADAGTVITVGVFNAAFLPGLPPMPFRAPIHTQHQPQPIQTASDVVPYFSDLGLNKGLVERFLRFAKNQTWVLTWLSGLTKTVAHVLRVLRRESSAKPISYEDEAAQKTQKKRRILKI